MRFALSIIFFIILVCLDGCDVGENMKGILNENEMAFIDNSLEPMLVKEGICSDLKECGENYHKYYTCYANEALNCEIYGVIDEKIGNEILHAMLASGNKIGQVKFWRHLSPDTGFFEKPLFVYTNRTLER